MTTLYQKCCWVRGNVDHRSILALPVPLRSPNKHAQLVCANAGNIRSGLVLRIFKMDNFHSNRFSHTFCPASDSGVLCEGIGMSWIVCVYVCVCGCGWVCFREGAFHFSKWLTLYLVVALEKPQFCAVFSTETSCILDMLQGIDKEPNFVVYHVSIKIVSIDNRVQVCFVFVSFL